jgi:hypothetical protein
MKDVFIVMQRNPIHYMASFPVGVFTDEELAKYVVEGTKARGENAWIESCKLDIPKEQLFVDWDKEKEREKNDKAK